MSVFFVTGSTGLVGSYICRKLLSEGHSVRAVRRNSVVPKQLIDVYSDIEWVDGNVLDVFFLEENLKGVDYVIHCAAIVSFSPKERESMYKINVEGSANIVNACLKLPSVKLCHISSVAAMGKGSTDIIDEGCEWESSPHNTHYAITKYLSEQEVHRGIAEGLDAVIVNPSIVLGFADWNRSSSQLFKYVFDQKKYFPKGVVNTVDVRDVANIVYQLCISSIHNQRFLLSNPAVPYKSFFEKVATQFDKKAPSTLVTPIMGSVAWRWEKLKYLITGKPPLLTKETVHNSQLSYSYNCNSIEETLNYKFTPLDETIKWCCSSFLNDKLNDSTNLYTQTS